MKNAIVKLMQLGFSEYEAKAYIALLQENPLTAYEIAKKSGIPTSKVYEVIRKLENKSTIQSIHGERSKMFIPLSAEEFVQSFRVSVEENLSAVMHALEAMNAGMDRSYTWHIRDYEGLIRRAKRMISTARTSILMLTWPPEIKRLIDPLCRSEEHGVRIAAIHYGATNIRIGQLFRHPTENAIHVERGIRNFTIVTDSREALNGIISVNSTEAIWSMNEGFVIMAEEYMRHDIYFMKTMKRFDPMLQDKFGVRYEKLLDIYADDEV